MNNNKLTLKLTLICLVMALFIFVPNTSMGTEKCTDIQEQFLSLQNLVQELQEQNSYLNSQLSEAKQELQSTEEQLERAIKIADQFKAQAIRWQVLKTDYLSKPSRGKALEHDQAQKLSITATAYTVDVKECGKDATHEHFKITYDGKTVKPWYTIAADKSIPFGTIVYIPYFADQPNEGIFVVEDRGSAITKGRIDVYMTDLDKAKAFGKRKLDVYIIGTIEP
jgi:3D (Asp-Asp-Asp) domain-containing protein